MSENSDYLKYEFKTNLHSNSDILVLNFSPNYLLTYNNLHKYLVIFNFIQLQNEYRNDDKIKNKKFNLKNEIRANSIRKSVGFK